jgi:CRP-like cAMP-binding protein
VEKSRICVAWRNKADCLACDGRENSFFAGLSPDVIATLHVDVGNTSLSSDTILYQPGLPAEHLWVLRTGVVKLTAFSWKGEPRIVRILKPGDVAGIEGLFAGSYAHTAVAASALRSCRIPIRAIRRLCLEHAGFQWSLTCKWLAALRETEQWLVDMTSAGATARVRMARLLLRLRDEDSNRVFCFSREDLGLMLGTTIETASRIIAAFLRERVLVRHGTGQKFYDADIARLEMLAQGR